MGIIKLLDDNTINKIAAGEVIEKPSSIVKELVENSIDAGATEITVEIKGGGISLIRVLDNGKGIEGDDLETAFLRHATSKISSDLDLNSIGSLGFRGEALASIAAVSRVEMISRKKDQELGNKLCLDGGMITSKEQCGSPCGTIITVRDLFFNTPARLKFLKSESREGMYITDIMQNLALSHSNISFKYKANEKMIFATKGDGDLKSVILSVYGKEITGNILELNCSRDLITIKGFIGNSNIAKNNRNHQSVFINGRYIKNKTVTAAVEAAYKSMITINKFPLYILHIYINPEFVDVNVHPAKAEVKFQDDQMIFKAVYHCVKDSLLTISPILDIQDNQKERIINEIPKINYTQQEFAISMMQGSVSNPSHGRNGGITISEENQKEFQDTEPSNRPFEIKEYHNQDKDTDTDTYYNQAENIYSSSRNAYYHSVDTDSPKENKIPKFEPLAVVGQVHFTYIIAEGLEDMYMIDQHAAHERIYYENYISEYKKSAIQSQNLIVPIILELTLSEKQQVFENIDIFKRIGYEIEDFGGNSIALRYVPLIYGTPDSRELFYEILSNFELKDKDIFSTIDRVMYTMACKSAVKAGDKLNYREMTELIERLRYCDNPFNCPHGRPTIIKMSYMELEKKFKRIQ